MRRVDVNGVRFLYGLEWSSYTNRLAITTLDDDEVLSVRTVNPDGRDSRRVFTTQTQDDVGACWSTVADVLYIQSGRGGVTDLLRLSQPGDGNTVKQLLLTGLPSTIRCEVSLDGRHLLQLRTQSYANLLLYDLRNPLAIPKPLTGGTAAYVCPDFSPDGDWVVTTLRAGQRSTIVKIPIAGGEPVPLTEGKRAAWSPDGHKLAFVSDRTGVDRVWVSDAEGSNAVEIEDSQVGNARITWLPDGRLAWQTPDAKDYRIRDLATGLEERLAKDPPVGWVFGPQFSPQVDQVAVEWNRDPYGLWVVSWPDRSERLLARDVVPVGWFENGKLVYGLRGRELVRVSVQTATVETLSAMPASECECDVASYRQIMVCSCETRSSDAWIIENFDPYLPQTAASPP